MSLQLTDGDVFRTDQCHYMIIKIPQKEVPTKDDIDEKWGILWLNRHAFELVSIGGGIEPVTRDRLVVFINGDEFICNLKSVMPEVLCSLESDDECR